MRRQLGCSAARSPRCEASPPFASSHILRSDASISEEFASHSSYRNGTRYIDKFGVTRAVVTEFVSFCVVTHIAFICFFAPCGFFRQAIRKYFELLTDVLTSRGVSRARRPFRWLLVSPFPFYGLELNLRNCSRSRRQRLYLKYR